MGKHHTYLGKWFADWMDMFVKELHDIFTDGGVLIIFFLGGLLYPVLYNLVYSNGTLDDMPVAVVNHSGGEYSRRYIQKVDASRECAIEYHCADMVEAEDLMREGKVHGIIMIPSDFDDNVTCGRQGVISTYADMSSFLYYKDLTTATSLVMLDEMHTIQAEHYAASGFVGEEAQQLIMPVQSSESMPYNRAASYTIFFLSAALMLVIQQTMYYGSSMLAGTRRERFKRSGYDMVNIPRILSVRGVGRIVWGRAMAYVLVYIFIGTVVLQLIPYLFNFPQRADWWEVEILLLVYLLDCVFFCFTWSTMITRKETVFVLFLSISPICLFLTGFSWPSTAMPWYWRALATIFPSTYGCRAFINLNTAGGTLLTIAPELVAMTIQTILYFALANVSVYLEYFVVRNYDKIRARRRDFMRSRLLDPDESERIIAGDME